jgi:hypothetical protein
MKTKKLKLSDLPYKIEIKKSKKPLPSSSPAPTGPHFKVTRKVSKGTECQLIKLLVIGNWEEIKIDSEVQCIGTPFGDICSSVPVTFHRTCQKYVGLRICYPTGVWPDIKNCVEGAAVAGTIAAVIASPEAGGAVFEAALKECLTQAGFNWADQVTADGVADSDCGDWH